MKKSINEKYNNSFFDKRKFLSFSHRGFAKDYDENTIKAFEKAQKIGFDFFELDVRSSKDKIVYVFHDKGFGRLTKKKYKISSLMSDQIETICLKKGGKVLKLRDLFKIIPNGKFNIDIKSYDTIKPFCNLIKEFKMENKICVASFSDKRIKEVIKNLGPNTLHSMGRARIFAFFIFFMLGLNYKCSSSFIQLPSHYFCFPLISKKIIKYAHNLNYKLHVWTINNEKEMVKYIEMGVDGIMTDECVKLKNILIYKKKWHSY